MVAQVLDAESEDLLGAGGLSGAVADLAKLAESKDKGSLVARVCAAKAMVLTDSGSVEVRDKAVGLVRGGLEGRGVTVKGCADAVEAVAAIVGEAEGGVVTELREACAKVFPSAEAFSASS